MNIHLRCCLLVLLSFALLMPADFLAAQQDVAPDAYWRKFDQRFPEIAGQGQTIWEKAGEIAALQLGSKDDNNYNTTQTLIFQALAVHERDKVIARKRATTSEENDWIKSRREASMRFEQNVAQIKQLRKKPEDQLTQADMTRLLRASVAMMQYIYDAQLQAQEAFFEDVINENQKLREAQARRERSQPDSNPDASADADKDTSTRPAKNGEYRCYLHSNRIRVGGNYAYDDNHVSITGAIRNDTDKPARFEFKAVAMRSGNRPVGFKVVKTQLIRPGDSHEIDVHVPVEHSAYVRGVDMRDVRVTFE